MNDLERELRDLLHEDAHRVSTPSGAPNGLGGAARWRQASFVALVGGTALALVAAIVAGVTLLPPERSVPAVEPETTRTLNGITITYPRAWVLIDPDAAGLNGPDPTTVELPRLILALAPTDPGAAFGCPGLAGGDVPTFLMTVQEEPMALAGANAVPWPVQLEAMDVGNEESACYPGWDFLRAGWAAEGRTFEARLGLAPDVDDRDREALLAAFASMTFEPSTDGASAVVLATGTAGGEDWQLIATRQKDGMSLSVQTDRSGAGTGGFVAASEELQATSHAIGNGGDVIVFGAVPLDVVRVEALPAHGGPAVATDVIDVPDDVDPRVNAFVLVLEPDPIPRIDLNGYDATGHTVIQGSIDGIRAATPPDAELEDGRHFGYIRSVDMGGRTIEFDLAYWLSGEEANAAFQAAGGTGPVPDDYYVVNDEPTLRTLPLGPDVRLRLLDWNHCCETFFDGDLARFGRAIREQTDVTDGDLVYRGQSQWWVTVENGVVTEIEEQYSP